MRIVKEKNWLWIFLASMVLLSVCCVGVVIGWALFRRESTPSPAEQARVKTSTPPPPPTVTPFPTPPPPSTYPSDLPLDSDLRDLVQYANAMYPLLVDAGVVLNRDGEILKASEGGNDAVLCDGRLEEDNLAMEGIINNIRAINPPPDAEVIHNLVLRSGDAWIETLDNIELFCDTANQLYKIPAVIKFWEAAASIQDAGNRFWLLLLSKGVEDWVQR